MGDDQTDADAHREFERRVRDRYGGLEVVSTADNGTFGAGPADRAAYTREVTPVEEFYILNHYPTPTIDEEEWTVSLTGAVEEPVDLSVDDIREEYPTTTTTHTLECAGNGRSYFASVEGEPGKYIQWRHNAAGTAEWTGTPLSAVLRGNGADTGTGTWVTAVGGDAPDGEDVFARSLPMEKVLDDCLLAYRMNGEPLPPEHGFPVRVIVPGWYGVNSVKWVEELRVMDRMMAGPEWSREKLWQQHHYRLKFADEGVAEHEAIEEFDTWDQFTDDEVPNPYLYDQNVTSLVGYPGDGAVVEAEPDGGVEVLGAAWAGDDPVETVEVSADTGETWHEANFVSPDRGATAWRLFRCVLDLPPGDHRLVSRATDEHGRSQPARVSGYGAGRDASDDEYPWNREGYGHNAYEDYAVEFTLQG